MGVTIEGTVGRGIDAASPPSLSAALREADEQLAGLAVRRRRRFLERLEASWPDLVVSWAEPYGGHQRAPAALLRLVRVMAQAYRARPSQLRAVDDERSSHPDWFQAPEMIGYVCYVDRFAGTISRVAEHIDYLGELGVRYLHLMPLLRTRPGDNDGGYAVTDYGAVEPRLGTIEDLEDLCTKLRGHGISVCVDLVLNHTAVEHPWAQLALAGDPEAERLYWIFPDRTEPDRYELTLPEVFPEFAPGNFSQLPDGRWAWTTFNEFQWDLNWSNPDVFVLMADVLLALANRGVDVIRLDAIPFLWKAVGTDCQNQPQVHAILRALRDCARIVAPGVIFKAEAIVAPEELTRYLGAGPHDGREADLAYHNSLMVQFWSAIATRDVRLMRRVLADFPVKPPGTAWATYLRNHDDIGWAVTDAAAASVGWTGRDHRLFLTEFYSGAFPASFSRGAVFQFHPETGDSRISGTAASLAGVESALDGGTEEDLDQAIARVLLGHALIMGWNGIPLLYMGDEIGLLNDHSYLAVPDTAEDNRWIHRPRMDWAAAATRHDPTTVAGRLFAGVSHLARARATTPQIHADYTVEVLEDAHRAVFTYLRNGAAGPLLAVHNMSEEVVRFDRRHLRRLGATGVRDLLGRADGDPLRDLGPYAVRWLVARAPESGTR